MRPFIGKLSAPLGKHLVGAFDVELPPESTKLATGLLFRIYYPIDDPVIGSTRKLARWLPSHHYAYGYASIILNSKILASLVGWLSWWVLGGVKMTSTFLNCPLKKPDACYTRQSTESPVLESAPATPTLYPVVLFSHGLGGMRTSYSQICRDLASSGLVVCALEHRDGSACCSLIPTPVADITEKKRVNRKALFYGAPNPKIGTNESFSFRSQQVAQRLEEISLTLIVLAQLHEAAGPLLDSLIPSDDLDAASHAKILQSFSHSLNMQQIAIAGHSQGAATAISALWEMPEMFKCGVAYDAWMFPVKHEIVNVQNPFPRPLVSIRSETFSWPRNTAAIHRVLFNSNSSRLSEIEGNHYLDKSVRSPLPSLPTLSNVQHSPANLNTIVSSIDSTSPSSTLMELSASFILKRTGHHHQNDFPALLPRAFDDGRIPSHLELVSRVNSTLSCFFFSHHLTDFNFTNDTINSSPLQSHVPSWPTSDTATSPQTYEQVMEVFAPYLKWEPHLKYMRDEDSLKAE